MSCGYIVEGCGSELLQGVLTATISSTLAAKTSALSEIQKAASQAHTRGLLGRQPLSVFAGESCSAVSEPVHGNQSAK
jgi:translation elongation factor EF-G